MKTLPILICCALSGIAAVAGAQISLPTPGQPGSSPDSAVRVVVTSDLMVDRFIKRWLRTHYPGWSADPHEFTEIGFDRYAVVYISSPNDPSRRVYFRLQSKPGDPENDAFPR